MQMGAKESLRHFYKFIDALVYCDLTVSLLSGEGLPDYWAIGGLHETQIRYRMRKTKE
jgi:hypothetical protein